MAINGPRQGELLEAADLLLDARRTSTPIPDLPARLQPTSLEEARFIQSSMIKAYGNIGGWKVGAASPEAIPQAAPIPRSWIAANAATIDAASHRYRNVEAEIAFLIGKDLPPRSALYSEAEIVDAVASCHPAIEILESALLDPNDPSVNPLSKTADLQINGGLVYGAEFSAWRAVDFASEKVTLAVDAAIRVDATGSNPAGDLLRLILWLANDAAPLSGGLFAGQWITTGSWTGATAAFAGQTVDVRFSTIGSISLRFT